MILHEQRLNLFHSSPCCSIEACSPRYRERSRTAHLLQSRRDMTKEDNNTAVDSPLHLQLNDTTELRLGMAQSQPIDIRGAKCTGRSTGGCCATRAIPEPCRIRGDGAATIPKITIPKSNAGPPPYNQDEYRMGMSSWNVASLSNAVVTPTIHQDEDGGALRSNCYHPYCRGMSLGFNGSVAATGEFHSVGDIIGYAKLVRAQRGETLGQLSSVMKELDVAWQHMRRTLEAARKKPTEMG